MHPIMKIALVVGALCSLAATSVNCAGDNCNTIVGKPSRVVDCNSYLESTVTPSASTTTSTVYTIIGNVHYEPPIMPRAVTPAVTLTPTIPFYATSACTSKNQNLQGRYISACGATGTVVTASVPPPATVYTITTVTVSSFKIIGTAAQFSPYPSATLLPDENLSGSNNLGLKFVNTDPNTGSTVFRLVGGDLETFDSKFAQQDPGTLTSEWIWVDTPANIVANECVYVYFIVDPSSLALTAVSSDNGNSVLQVCELLGTPYLDLAQAAGLTEQTITSPCYPLKLSILPL